jgi:uncharacterized membrane protein YkoI
MKRLLATLLLSLSLMSMPAMAQSLEEAAREAARQYKARVLSARTVQEDGHKVHVIKLVTADGVVKTVRVTVKDRR